MTETRLVHVHKLAFSKALDLFTQKQDLIIPASTDAVLPVKNELIQVHGGGGGSLKEGGCLESPVSVGGLDE